MATGQRIKSTLIRNYIRRALYDVENGYFQTPGIIGVPKQPISFTELSGRKDYLKIVDGLYRENGNAWLTPAEIFRPWYSRSILHWIIGNHPAGDWPINIIEVGGGTGTQACTILDELEERFPSLYSTVRYQIVEISPALAKLQRKRCARHIEKLSIQVQDFSDWVADPKNVCEDPCVVLALEVIDNLPHDKIRYRESIWEEGFIQEEPGKEPVEKFRPLQDQVLKQALSIWKAPEALLHPDRVLSNLSPRAKLARWIRTWARMGKLDAWFVPSVLVQILSGLSQTLPRHSLLMADFDYLPPPSIKGSFITHPDWATATREGNLSAYYAPLVSSKKEGETQDHDSFLSLPGDCDIFFATDFERLASSYRALCPEHTTTVFKHNDFMEQHASLSSTKTKSGFNPLLSEYPNHSFLLTQANH